MKQVLHPILNNMVGSLYKYAACFIRKPYWQAGKPHIMGNTMTNETGWVNYSFSELGSFGEKIESLKVELAAAYAADAGVPIERVRVSFGRYGVGFLVVEAKASTTKKTLGQGGAPAAKPKSFGPRSPRLK
jgi:hypothetical protein